MTENKIIVDKETLEFKRYSNDFFEATEKELFMDEPIWKVCKILTDKGYRLNYSCGGHINIGAYKSKAVLGVEIGFCYDYGINPPSINGVKLTRNEHCGMHHQKTSVGYRYEYTTRKKDKELLENKRAEIINTLEAWASELGEVDF